MGRLYQNHGGSQPAEQAHLRNNAEQFSEQ